MRLFELLQHQVAPRPRAVGVFARIIERRTLDQADQQRHFTDVEFVEGLGEVIFAGESEAVYGTCAVLTEIHLVEVSDQDFFLGIVRLQSQCHDGLGCLAPEGLLVRQKVIFDELLRQGAASLHHAARPQVGPERAKYPPRIDPAVLVKAPILDHLDAGPQQGRHLGRRQHQTVLAVHRKHAADHGRIEAEHR